MKVLVNNLFNVDSPNEFKIILKDIRRTIINSRSSLKELNNLYKFMLEKKDTILREGIIKEHYEIIKNEHSLFYTLYKGIERCYIDYKNRNNYLEYMNIPNSYFGVNFRNNIYIYPALGYIDVLLNLLNNLGDENKKLYNKASIIEEMIENSNFNLMISNLKNEDYLFNQVAGHINPISSFPTKTQNIQYLDFINRKGIKLNTKLTIVLIPYIFENGSSFSHFSNVLMIFNYNYNADLEEVLFQTLGYHFQFLETGSLTIIPPNFKLDMSITLEQTSNIYANLFMYKVTRTPYFKNFKRQVFYIKDFVEDSKYFDKFLNK